MERIDPIIQPVPAAGTDPGYIPGLMAPRLVEEADDTKDVPPEAADEAVADEVTDKVSEEAKAPETPAADESDGADEAVGAAGPVALTKNTAESDSASAGTAADDEDGPVFDISDRRASMTADRTGVRFQLDETEAEFGWDEIGAVEVETPGSAAGSPSPCTRPAAGTTSRTSTRPPGAASRRGRPNSTRCWTGTSRNPEPGLTRT